jgi:EpsI family protein
VEFCIVFSQDNRKGTHPPDLCLEGGSGQDIIEKQDVVIPGVPGRGDVGCRTLTVQSGQQRNYFLYVYKCGQHYTPSFWTQQGVIFLNGLLSRNASGALIRVSTPVRDDADAARQRCAMMMKTAIPYLDAALP